MKKAGRRLLALTLAVLLSLSVLPLTARAEEAETIASWTIADSTITKGGKFSDKISELTCDISSPQYSGTGKVRYGGSGWSKGKGFTFDTPTTDCTSLTVSGKLYASNTGPGSVQLQGKVGEDWKNLGESIATSGGKTIDFSVEVSESGLFNQSKAEFRLIVDTEKAANGNNIGTAGTLYVQNGITITSGAGGTEPQPQPQPDEDGIISIKEALAGTEGQTYKVKGVITFIDGKNVYLQDSTGGICAYLPAANNEIKRGDVITASGAFKKYNGLPELDSATIAKTEDSTLTLKATEKTIKDLTDADICTYVTIKNAKVTAIDNQYITLDDNSGETISIYKAPATPEGLAVDSVTTVTAAVGTFNKLQLRTMEASDIVITSQGTTEPDPQPPVSGTSWTKVTAAPEDWSGTYLIVYEDESNGYIYNGKSGANNYADATITDSTISTDSTYAVTVEKDGENYLIKLADGNYMYTTSSNNADATLGSLEDAKQHPITLEFADGVTKILCNNMTFQFNNGKDQMRFRFFKLTSNQKPIALYKQGGSNIPTPPTPGELYKPVAGDQVVIYNGASNVAMTSTFAGASGTVSGTKLTLTEEPLYLTVEVDGEKYSFKDADNKYLTSNETGKGLSLGDKTDYSVWTLENQDKGWYIKNEKAAYNDNAQYLEYFGSSFTTFGLGTGGDAYLTTFFKKADVTVKATEPDPEEPDEPVDSGYMPKDNDKIVIFNPGSGMVMTGTASGTQLKGSAASASGGKLFTDGSELVLTVSVTDNNFKFTTEDGKVLSTKQSGGGDLTLEEDKADGKAQTWKIEEVDGGYSVTSVEAAYNNNHNQAMEVYNNNFTTYGFTANDAKFVMQFFTEAMLGTELPTDEDIEDTIAQWGGGGPYTDAQNSEIKGDLFKSGDMLDDNAKFTVRANGKDAQPYQRTNGSGSTPESPNYNYYMGGENIGAQSGDYMQFAVSSKGYGDMSLSFRIRVTGTGAKYYTLQYSADGTHFSNFETGEYSYSYTAYSSDGSQTPVSGSGKVTDGRAFGLYAGGKAQYVSFVFDVPVGADNVDNLTIRLVPGTEKLNGTGSISGNVRIDSVKLIGSPITDETLPGYVTADPDGVEEDVPAGTDITLKASNNGATVSYRFVKVDGTDLSSVTWTTGNSTTLPKELPVALEVKASKNGQDGPVRRYIYNAGTVESVKMSPNGGGIVFTDSETATITLTCATAGATIMYRDSTMTKDEDGNGETDFVEYKEPITVNKGFGTLTVDAYATKEGLADSAVTSRTFTERSKEKYDLYFGQMHSHTGYSDGTEDPAAAYQWVKNLSESYNMDFLSVTDHSNSLDNAGGTRTINDPVTGEWTDGHESAKAATTDKFVGIFGYEMTWSNGLGHINTFNTTGFQDRTQSDYTTYSTALQNYYAALKTAPASISQFNHPGTTFGDFSDFAHYDPEIDELITLIEVGNGEGAIGSSGYFPSYEYYTRALDKGWHVAPTNNQDNHKGHWGDANNGRDVVLVDELTETAIYDAMRNYRVYATEDLNLEIYYTFDGQLMGTQLTKDDVGDTAIIKVELNDPDAADQKQAKVEVIVNGGLVAASTNSTLKNETVEIEVPTTYNYYYIKITQADGDIAVTAPVWVGAVEAIGVSSFTAQNALTVVGEEQTFDLSLYNNEKKALDVSSIVITNKNTGETITTLKDITKVKKMGTAETSFKYTFKDDGIFTLTATVKGVLDGVEKTYTQDLEVTVMPAKLVTNIIVDGTHFNDYVTGYYGGNMGNMTTIAANNAVQVTVVRDKITADMLKNCSLLVLSAPAKQSSTANAGDYTPSLWEDDFIAMVKDYVQNGGSVVVAGLADYQDDKSADTVYQSSVQQNKLLEAIGSTMTINDDEAYDLTNNGGQAYRLYPATFNMDSEWTKGIINKESVEEGETFQTYSQYSGCTVDPGDGTWLVKGYETTFSVDSDKDGRGALEETITVPTGNDSTTTYNYVVKEGDAYFLAHEKVGKGNVFVSGGVFLSDFEVKAELDNIWDLPYANRTIYENILRELCLTDEVTDIADTRKADLNKIFVIEGYVTNGTEYPDKTNFFDAIYVQDETGGTTCFPYATEGLAIGTKVRILGYTDAYQDDREIQIISLSVIDGDTKIYEPKVLTTKQASDYATYGGQLVKTTGKVSDIVRVGGDESSKISQFKLTDSSGVAATIFVDGYIFNKKGEDPVSSKIKKGMTVTAVGLSYMHPEGEGESVCVLRVRDMDEIELDTKLPSNPSRPGPGTTTPTTPSTPAPDVTTGKENGSTETVATPDVIVSGSSGSVTVPVDMGDEIVRQVKGNNSDTAVVAPEFPSGVTKADVTVPAKTVKELGETKADLRIETPAADVTIPNAALAGLAQAGNVTVSTEKNGETVTVSVTAGGKAVDTTVKAALALSGGDVAYLVSADGTETIIPKSVVENGVTYVLIDGSATIKVLENSKTFTDVKATDWFAGYVDFVTSHTIFDGTGGTNFEPRKTMNRAMLATVIWKLEGRATTENGMTFSDVAAGTWYSEGIAWASANGIVQGSDGKFDPERAVTRQEMAVMIYNYAKGLGLDMSKTAGIDGFADASEVSSWAKDAMSWAYANGIITGTGTGLNPAGTASRSEVAAVLQRLVSLIVK